jgi:hypothetical protein
MRLTTVPKQVSIRNSGIDIQAANAKRTKSAEPE